MRVSGWTSSFLVGAAIVVALSGCSGGTTTPGPSASASTSGASAASAPSSTPGASSTCGPATGADAAAAGIARLPLPAGLSTATWNGADADYSGYDACAALSWSVVTVADSTPSSPSAILLFHDGAYLGTATAEQYGFSPTVTRTSPDAITVTYRYATGTDSNADPTGRTTATFTWNPTTSRVTMTGRTPPEG